MSYTGIGAVGLGQNHPCPEYVVRADGRCYDGQLHHQQWYNKSTGKCEEPPTKICDVNAPNLPDTCPPGTVLNPGSPGNPAAGIPAGCAATTSPPSTTNCKRYRIYGDFRCKDGAGIHAMSWLDKFTGKCINPNNLGPPPPTCDITDPCGMPVTLGQPGPGCFPCPPNTLYNPAALPTGCIPTGGIIPPVLPPVQPPPGKPPVQPPPVKPPVQPPPKGAKVGSDCKVFGLPCLAVGLGAAALGLILVTGAGARKRRKRKA
jgi:hypothetical protein